MFNMQTIIDEAIMEIMQQKSSNITNIEPEHSLITDLGFDSLDTAQLIAILEIKLGVDPFATQIAIANIRTIKDLCDAYSKTLAVSCAS